MNSTLQHPKITLPPIVSPTSEASVIPSETPIPTVTPVPTETALPTETPLLSSTPSNTPTRTSTPTRTRTGPPTARNCWVRPTPRHVRQPKHRPERQPAHRQHPILLHKLTRRLRQILHNRRIRRQLRQHPLGHIIQPCPILLQTPLSLRHQRTRLFHQRTRLNHQPPRKNQQQQR